MTKIFRVSSEFYDRAWLVNTKNKRKAIKLVREYTESLCWHKSYPDEKRDFEVEQILEKEDVFCEISDL